MNFMLWIIKGEFIIQSEMGIPPSHFISNGGNLNYSYSMEFIY